MKEIVEILNYETDLALKEGEVPVACLITKNGKVISAAHNMKEALKDPLAHAEILCIRDAANKIGSWNLKDCQLYVSLMPCAMCQEVIKECRIKEVFYVLKCEKKINNNVKYCELTNADLQKSFKRKIVDFFKDKR